MFVCSDTPCVYVSVYLFYWKLGPHWGACLCLLLNMSVFVLELVPSRARTKSVGRTCVIVYV